MTTKGSSLEISFALTLMRFADLLRQRLSNQHVSGRPLDTPDAIVRALGAMQAQDYAAAQWAVGQRVERSGVAVIGEAFDRGAVIRTHVMRPTWHLVAPEDVRWLIELTAPRVNAICAHYYRKFELDTRVFAKSHAALVKALTGKALDRRAVLTVLERARVLRPGDDPLRLIFLLLRAELDGLICSGPREGKQFTYMLLEERVPPAKPLTREDALATLTRRYFVSHGPAVVQDFSWWSGLSTRDARAGIEALGAALDRHVIDGQTYYHAPQMRSPKRGLPAAYLIPAYDEALLSYRDSRLALKPHSKHLMRHNGQVIAIDGQPVGAWKRTTAKGGIVVHATPFAPLKKTEKAAIAEVADRYGRFFGAPASVQFNTNAV